eukprot:TRINITY_DN3351_c0_g2_i1.p1 TRINITY_DN3351_c0_g2~~TRINITY_DN3351_c0_g2_i1.p1  ORF type:complete len:165 (+),score=54.20 TRINITY_DN3351_c0_g2_i1:192-686(+)
MGAQGSKAPKSGKTASASAPVVKPASSTKYTIACKDVVMKPASSHKAVISYPEQPAPVMLPVSAVKPASSYKATISYPEKPVPAMLPISAVKPASSYKYRISCPEQAPAAVCAEPASGYKAVSAKRAKACKSDMQDNMDQLPPVVIYKSPADVKGSRFRVAEAC